MGMQSRMLMGSIAGAAVGAGGGGNGGEPGSWPTSSDQVGLTDPGALTVHNGNFTASTDTATTDPETGYKLIENWDVTEGNIVVDVNAVVRNCRVRGIAGDHNGSRLIKCVTNGVIVIVEDSELGPDTSATDITHGTGQQVVPTVAVFGGSQDGASGFDITFRRVYTHHVGDVLRCNSGAGSTTILFEDCYLTVYEAWTTNTDQEDHTDISQVLNGGVIDMTFIRCYCNAGHDDDFQAIGNGVLQNGPPDSNAPDVASGSQTLDNCYVGGANYIIRCYMMQNGVPVYTIRDVVLEVNSWGMTHGPHHYMPEAEPYITWENNTYSDGTDWLFADGDVFNV